jgi:protein TonB
MAVTVPVSGASLEGGGESHASTSEPSLTLGGYGLTETDPLVQGRRAVTLPVSILLHAAAALAIVLVPLLASDVLPEQQSSVRAFFVEPLSVPPPPPPPAARPAAAPRVAPKPQPQTQAFVAPVEVPTEITPEQALDLGGDDTGSADGVDGGVPGGVVGGIVGGLPEAPPPPVTPVRVGGMVREPRRLVVVPPVYPEVAAKARIQGTVIVEATVNERGRVVNVSLVQGAPLFSDAALEAVKKWVYTPTLVSGVPTPIIMTVTVHFRLNGPTV